MKMESDFHMAKGGETSYSNNSSLQQKALFESKPVLEKAVEACAPHVLHGVMVICDLGCSAGQNTLTFVSEVINAMRFRPVGLQFFLNDLPYNDFNHIFQSLEQFQKSIAEKHNGNLPPFYIAGLPGSYYTRLFPSQSVHLFHSSFCLHWRSRLPDGLDGNGDTYINRGNIYIAKTSPPCVVKLYQEQFQKDLKLFLQLRHEELVHHGQIVLTFPGRKNKDAYNGDLNDLCGLLANSLQSLVDKGLVDEDKLKSFNLPIYGPSIDEVKALLKENDLFDITHISMFEPNWDPYDHAEDDSASQDSVQSGVNVAKSIRAVTETLLASHFGESILDPLFKDYARKTAEHLRIEKTKYSVLVLSLQKR